MSKAKVNISSDNKPLPLRVRVFSKWVSIKLRKKGITVHNIINEARNGAILVNLAEVLTKNTKHEVWTRNPTKPFQFIENIELALCLFKNHGVKFHYQIVNPKEINAGNVKAINSLIWSLIMKYTIEPVVFTKNENMNSSNHSPLIDSLISNTNLDNNNSDEVGTQNSDNKEQNESNNENNNNVNNEENKNNDNNDDENEKDNTEKNSDENNENNKNESNNENDVKNDNNNETNDKNENNNESNDNENKTQNNNIESQKLFKNRKHLALLLLLKWCTDNTSNYPEIDSCRPVNLAFAALLNNFRPDVMNYKKNFNKNDRSIAISIMKAMKALKIPILIESEDLLNPIDDRSFFTQVALIKEVLQPRSDTNIEDVFELKKQLISFENGDNTSGIGKSASLCSLNAYNEYDDDDDDRNDKREMINLQNSNNNPNYSSGGFSSGSGADNFPFFNYEKPASHRPFMLLMTMDDNGHNSRVGKMLAMTVFEEHLLNPAGYRIDLATPNRSDPAQQFTFGEGEWITVIDSVKKPGMVWDVANADSTDPPEGTPFYLFPFHGRHNQRFTYEQGRILATQNMQAVTFVGNQYPFVMKKVCESSSSLQIFKLQYV